MGVAVPWTGCACACPGVARRAGGTRRRARHAFTRVRRGVTQGCTAGGEEEEEDGDGDRDRAGRAREARASSSSSSSSSSFSFSPGGMRLWSALDSKSLVHVPGSVGGAAALVAGTTVGAGVLALPQVTVGPGFAASTVAILIGWLYMYGTGLLLAETTLTTLCAVGRGGSGVSLLSVVNRVLGPVGVTAFTSGFLFLHYALLVAYDVKAGSLIEAHTSLQGGFGAPVAAFALGLGGVVYLAPPAVLDGLNTVLVLTLSAVFLGLVATAAPGIHVEPNLGVWHPEQLPPAVPLIALSFVYHNIVPYVVSSLEGDMGKVRVALGAGTAVPAAMFLTWNAVILGTIDPDVALGGGAVDPVALVSARGGSAGGLVDAFSAAAVTTSYIGFALALSELVDDALRDALPDPRLRKAASYALALAPPAVFAAVYPDAFLGALDAGGAFGCTVLFGVLPPLMAWRERYGGDQDSVSSIAVDRDYLGLPGGKPVLLAVGGAAAAVVASQTLAYLHPT